MTENWQQVKKIFDDALQLAPAERIEYARKECGDDRELLAEVEALLASHENANSFLENPVFEKIADSSQVRKGINAGETLGPYEIIEQIGEGGMGEVYLAVDPRLKRKVAVKLLADHITEDEGRVARFRQEAFATSALNHPNIITIYEIGTWEGRDFIVTEFIGGETLREWLRKKKPSMGEAIDVALQVASSLTAAHGAGIVHRDIKPENIMIREDGLVKVLDFGIAKYRPADDSQEALVKTDIGEIIGTAAYMSPEQARGLEVDAQTDIWSLGVILYEMLAGKLPFQGATRSDRIAAILEHDPAPLAKTGGTQNALLQRVIDRALAKDKSRRYGDVIEMAGDLHKLRDTTGDRVSKPMILSVRRPAVSRRPYLLAAVSLMIIAAAAAGIWFYVGTPRQGAAGDKITFAVLPLKPIDQANRDELYEIGIADSLIQRVSTIKGFVVRPLNAIRKYADLEQDPIAAGQEQQVDYVLASNYQIAGGKIRLTAQLLNISTGAIEDTYKDEKEVADVFAMQDGISEGVGRFLQLHFQLASAASSAKRDTEDEEAYRLYLQGMYFYDKRTRPDAYKAVEVLEEAVRLDPGYARAWAGLAHAYRYLINLGGVTVNIHDETRKSIAAVNNALALDNEVSEAYSALCDNKMYYEYDFVGAESACRQAIDLKPGSPLARNTYGRFLMSRGRWDEAIAEFRTAIEFEPTSYFHQIVYLTCLAQARRYDEAARQMDRLAELNPGNAFRLYWHNAGALMTQEDPREAFGRWVKYYKLAGADERTIRLYETIYQAEGWPAVMREQARRNKLDPVEHEFLIAAIHAQIGDNDTAMEFLEKSYARREFWMAHLRVEPRLDPLRSDPRFEDLVRRVEGR
jgi:serine/threonine protein kinase/Tfp pilus assembly protein PilF/TolB-like protein